MEIIIVTLNNALILASVYILVALGFAFLFNMLGILNFAHGAIYMTSGYVSFALTERLLSNPWLALLITVVLMAALGVFLEKFCFRPFRGDFTRIIIVSIAITIILQTTVTVTEGTRQMSVPAFFPGVLKTPYFWISYERIFIFLISSVSLGLILWFVNNTRWGQQMQAISQNIEGAALQGINIFRVSSIACAVGLSMAALAGSLMGSYLSLQVSMGDDMLTKVLVIVILAGAGSFKGIFYIGIILGVLYSTLPLVIPGAAGSAVASVIVIILLLIRPQGFFGHEA